MGLHRYLAVLGGSLSILPAVNASFSAGSSGNVAVYWGQNSFNQGAGPLAQQRLSTYCSNTNIDIIPIAFLVGIKSPSLNFANQADGCQQISGSSLIYCPKIEEDIKTCQNTYGKTILISFGGYTYAEGGFVSSAEAIANAENVWSWFGSSITAASPRPFGSAIVDGFDFDFETSTDNLVPFAQRLRQLADESGRKFLFTAAPQCPYPDRALGPILAGAVRMDAVFVQYYNNDCGIQNFVRGAGLQPKFNFDSWDTWAKTVSANPNVKVLLGVPGNERGGAGYMSASWVALVIEYAQRYSSFGGVMVWDASQMYSNDGFLETIRGALGKQTAASPVAPGWAPTLIISSPNTQPTSVERVQAGGAASAIVTLSVDLAPVSSTPEIHAPVEYIVGAPVIPTPPTPLTLVISETAVVDTPSVNVKVPADVTPEPITAPAPDRTVVEATPAPELTVSEWGQCGGIGYTGPTQCAAGLVCAKGGSEWWYSCKKLGYAWRA